MISYDEFKRLDVNHITHGSQRNNTLENLEVITRKANLAHARTNPNRKSNAKALSKPILGKRKCDATWTEFASATEAERVLNKQEDKAFSRSHITKVCKKRAKSHHGYEFQYNEQPDLDGEVWKWNPFLKVQCSNLGRVETTRGIGKVFACQNPWKKVLCAPGHYASISLGCSATTVLPTNRMYRYDGLLEKTPCGPFEF